ncbi:MAG: pseudouridine-5'-phosphate glycosidase [Saprospiraceae bacterium]|nr:pseudouridine-5'-phosphate glycosidase [Saprospiraceae bacterium]
MKSTEHLDITEEIRQGISDNIGIVALESTIISHGMPYPQNIETALRAESEVRKTGSIPATIAILNGKMKVGLSPDELDLLGRTGKNTLKCSRRDIPYALLKGIPGATTVAGTMIISDLAGIRIFVTGGIGGVHRGASQTMDISADLQELAKTNVCVVSAGVKSILDIGLTLEYLETMGVPVIGYGTHEFPAFFTQKSGFKTELSLHSPEEIAGFLNLKWNLPISGGVLIANPIPEEADMNNDFIEEVIKFALKDAELIQITGKEVTPFLLSRMVDVTEGKSLLSNIELVVNNAKLAGKIAKMFCEDGSG